MADSLTVDSPPPGAIVVRRAGSIVLARHGEPAISRKVWINAEGYRQFWAQYEVLGILPGQTPPGALMSFVAKAGAIISSTRQRSIDTALALTQGREFVSEAMFVEAPLPPPNLPNFIKLTPALWGFVARVWWWFFHHHGQETRGQAEQRADEAAERLIQLAEGGEDVVVLAHGFFNFMVGRALRRRGWRMTASEGYKYWSMRRFERP
ncbi:histidine phosphatase family protein [Phenylobacterium sp.]|jgi:broad specificity phosphatase PhoE|uniref:histidine phosphatase family protein n=1 Tax=Phenylobacterium sp. TaxID=1871053 RepID=UPI0008D3A429|nr:histidine phosphatase family protein [Phenylobacterium sp.]MBA4793931.1 histidine phosphatase family protein [Phenylobacterium sp.]MBC7167523.1 histidine phosphatase family protein [Phenylobacterium sp.]OHB37140.1 MAG: histidine phosphatase family protein [Phenylobacterium sp. RIFCSPHIGHO2_01_FULL_70_10]